MCGFWAAGRCGPLSPLQSELTQDNAALLRAPPRPMPRLEGVAEKRDLRARAAQARLDPALSPSGDGGVSLLNSRYPREAHAGQEAYPGGIWPGTPRILEAEAHVHARPPRLLGRPVPGRACSLRASAPLLGFLCWIVAPAGHQEYKAKIPRRSICSPPSPGRHGQQNSSVC
ncbi:uncharacterized protein LOC116527156 [Sapajus apella]|uniref:Uncharacterized protein LOC116527156 n=1 Tax=Sapajus apella TaxID=9515 RepID=A0A6J3F2S4_SAPAP|nr:uncharacterized protein LOC116527156 [Sapajus apella]